MMMGNSRNMEDHRGLVVQIPGISRRLVYLIIVLQTTMTYSVLKLVHTSYTFSAELFVNRSNLGVS